MTAKLFADCFPEWQQQQVGPVTASSPAQHVAAVGQHPVRAAAPPPFGAWCVHASSSSWKTHVPILFAAGKIPEPPTTEGRISLDKKAKHMESKKNRPAPLYRSEREH